MRVAAEAIDDLFVSAFKVEIGFQARLREQFYGVLVNQFRFTVHERHIEKRFFGWAQGLIGMNANRFLRQGKS